MKIVYPVGRNEVFDSKANYDIQLRGCTCDNTSESLFDLARGSAGSGCAKCGCQCSYGDENKVANMEQADGRNRASVWN